MRVSLGTIVVLGAVTSTWAFAGSWVGEAQSGLGRLLTVDLPAPQAHGPLLASWHGPATGTSAPSVAMSESDWLKLADDLAPVSYLTAPEAPENPDQQPL